MFQAEFVYYSKSDIYRRLRGARPLPIAFEQGARSRQQGMTETDG
jgi:hypothetical protein